MASRVGSYIGNLGKSISYAAIDVVKDNAKNTAGFIETNADLFKEIYAGVRDYNKTFTRIGTSVRDSKVYKAANEYKTSLFEDIKSGKFYNKDEDRENRLNNAASGGLLDGFGDDTDMSDFDIGDDWGDSSDNQEESKTVSAIERTTKASVEANSMAIARTGEYIVANSRAANNILFSQNAKSLELMSEGFNSIGKEINLIRQVVSGPMTSHAENSKKYFETSLGFFEKMSNTLTEMNERQKKQFETVASVNSSKTKKIGYSDVVDAGGMPDLKEYMNIVGKNAKKMMGPTGDMLLGDTFGEGSNMLMAFVASPLSFIPKYLVNALIPNIVKNTAKELDGTIGTLFGNFIARFNKMAKGDNPLLQKIGELFGINTQSKNSLDTSKYKKDAVPFDGITKKSIIEVIPGYLRNIEKLLSGKPGNIYDFESGKWTNERTVAKDWKKINEDDPRNSAFADIIPYLKKSLEKVRPERKDDYDSLQNDMGKLLDYIYNNDGVIKVNDKDEMKKVQSEISISDASMAALTKVMRNADRSLMYGLSPSVLEAKNAKTKRLTAIEEAGVSPLLQMHNGSINTKEALSDKNPAYTNILVSTKDNKGNNLFYYLQSILGAIVKGNSTADLPTKDKYGKPIKYSKSKAPTGNSNIDSLLGVVPDNRPDNEKKTNKQREEERYDSATTRAKSKGQKVFYDKYGDDENIAKVNAELETQIQSKRIDDIREKSTNGDWFAKLKPTDDKYDKDGKKLSLMDKLLTADSLTSKFKVMQESIKDIVKMPTNFLVATMESADKRLYQLLFGYDGKEVDKNGKPIKGFLGHMLNESSKAFDHFNQYLDENILEPLKKKLGIENFGDLFDKIATAFGFDEERRDGIKNKVKDFFKPFGDSINKAFSEALEATKKAVQDTYSPVVDMIIPEDKQHGKSADSIFSVNHKMDLDNPLDQTINNATGITRMEKYDANKEDHDKRGKELADIFNGIAGSITGRTKAKKQREDDIAANKEAGIEIEGYAKGAKYITKSGITAISKGEMIIPANLNPLNPDKDTVDIKKQGKEEELIKGNYIDEVTKRLKLNIEKNNDGKSLTDPKNPLDPIENTNENRDPLEAGTKDINSPINKAAVGAKRVINAGGKAANELKDGVSYLYKRLIGNPKDDEKALSNAIGDIGKNIKEYAPDAVGYGLLGGTVSLLTGAIGGPLLGAAAGAAIGIVKKSKGLQDILFGKVDEETNERTGGVVSADFQKKFKQYFPDMKTLGLAGAVTGLITPFGPIGGLMIGSAIGFAKSNAGVQKFLFGELNEETGEKEGGLISEKTQKLIKSAAPKMLVGAVGTLLLGPFGIVGNAALGAGLGLVASTDKFKDIMFGKADENGEREGGVIGAIRTGVIDPIKDALVGFKETFLDFMQENIMNPLKDFISPMGQELKNMFEGIGRSISGYFTDRFEKSIGIPLDQLIKEKLIQPMTKFFGGVFKATLAPAKMLVSAPFKALGGIGNHMRRGQIKKGMAGNMTAEERLQFMEDKPGMFGKLGGDYKTKKMDLLMKDQDLKTLKANRDALGAIEGGKGYFEKKIGTSKHNMSEEIVTYMRKNKLDTMMTPKQRNQFIKAAQSGDIDFAKEILRTTHKNGAKRMDKEDQEGLGNILSKYSKEIEETRDGQKVVDKSKKDILAQLSQSGVTGINSKNIHKYLAMYDTEYKAKKRLGKNNATADDAQDPVMAKIISEKSNKQITLLQRLVSIMEEHYGIKKTNDSVKVEKEVKDKDETFSTVNANGEPINFKKSTDGSSIGATADDNKKILEGKEAAKTQKGILGALTSFTGKIGDFFKGKKKGDSDEDEEDDGKKKKSSFIGKILKGLFTSKATKVVAGVVGGITGVALIGHIGKWWDEKAFPAIKNWFEESAFGQKVVGFLGSIATNIGNLFGNITDWFSGSGKYDGAGFPYFWKNGVVPFYTIGISYFLETMLPNLITTAFKTLPHLLMGVVKGIGSILKTPIDQLLGKKAIGKKEEPISIGSAFKQSMSSNMAMNSNVPGGKEYLRNKFGNVGKFASDNKEVIEKYNPNQKSDSNKSGGVIMNQDGTISTYSYDDLGNPVFDGTGGSSTANGTTSESILDQSNESILDQLQKTFGGEKKEKPAMFGLDNEETTAEAATGGLLRALLTGKSGLVGALAHTKYGQGLSRLPIVGKFVDVLKMIGHPVGEAANAAAKNGHDGLAKLVSGGAEKASMAFGGKAAKNAGYNAVSGVFTDVLTKNASQEMIDKASREYVENLAKKQAAKTGVNLSEEFIQKAATTLSKNGQSKIIGKMGIGTMEEIADTAVKEGTEKVAKSAVKEGVEKGAKKGLLDPIIKWVSEQLSKLFSNKTIVGKVAEGIGKTGSKAAAGASKMAKEVLEKILTKILATFGEHAAKSVAKVTAKFASVIGSAGTITVVFAVADFISGFNNANTILGITEMPNFGMRLVTGLLKCVNGFATMGIIPEDILVDIFVQFLAPMLKIDVEELKKDRDAAVAEIEQWNSTHGEDEQFDSVQQFNDKDKLSTKIKKGFGNAWDGVKDFFGIKKKDKKKKSNETVLDKAADAANSGLKNAGSAVREYGERVSGTGLPIVTEATDPNPQYTPEGLWIQPANTTSGVDYNQLMYTTEINAGGSMNGGAGVSPQIANQAMESSGISPTGYNEADVIAASTANIDPAVYEGIVGSLTNLIKTNNILWNQNLDKTINLVSSGDFITDKDVFTDEFKTELKANIVSGLKYSIGRAWMVASDLSIAKIDQLFGIETDKRQTSTLGKVAKGTGIGVGVGAVLGGLVGTIIGPVGTVLGAKIGAGIGGAIGGIAGGSNQDEKYNSIAEKTAKTVNNISNDMLSLYTNKLDESIPFLEEIKADDSSMPEDYKKYLMDTCKGNIKDMIGKAWMTAAQLASYKIDMIFGRDERNNKLNTIVGTSAAGTAGAVIGGIIGTFAGPVGTVIGAAAGGAIGGLIGNFVTNIENEDADFSRIQQSAFDSVNNISNAMMDVYTNKLNHTIPWMDEIKADENFMPPELKVNLNNIVRDGIKVTIANAWQVAGELSKDKFNKALGLDGGYNFWNGLKEFGSNVVAGAAIGSMTLNPIGVAIGAVTGALAFIDGKINENSPNQAVLDTVNNISNSMQTLYTEKLGWSKTWLDEIVISDDFMPTEFRAVLENKVRTDVRDMIGSAWAVSSELAKSKFNKALGLDAGYNFWNGLKDFGAGAITGAAIGVLTANPIGVAIGAAVGVFGTLFAKIEEANVVDQSIETSIDNLSKNMMETYIKNLTNSEIWLQEIVDTENFTGDIKPTLVAMTKDGVKGAIGSAWQVAGELAKNKFNVALGLDKGHNFWSGLKELGTDVANGAKSTGFDPLGIGAISGVFKFLGDKINEATEVDQNVAGVVDGLVNSMQSIYNSKLTWSASWLDEIATSDNFMPPEYKESIVNIVRNDLKTMIGNAWQVAGELARNKFNVALGLDKGHNFWSGLKELGTDVAIGAGAGAIAGGALGALTLTPFGVGAGAGAGAISGAVGGVFKFLGDKIVAATEVDSEVATVVDTLVTSMKNIYTTKVRWSISWLDAISTSDNFMPPEFRTGLENTVRSDLNIMIGNAWQIASELAKNKFNSALGLDKGHNFWSGLKELGTDVANGAKSTSYDPLGIGAISGVFKFLGDKINEATEVDSEVAGVVDELSSSMNDIYTTKIKWSKSWLDDILKDDSFLSNSKESIINIVRTNLNDTLTLVWEASSANNMSNWGSILKSMTLGNPALNDMYNNMDITTNPYLDTNKLPVELQETKVNMESIFNATNTMWNQKLVAMLDVVNAGSLGDIDLVTKNGEFSYKPINDGAKDLESSYGDIKVDLKSNNTNMNNYFSHNISDNSAFSGIRKMMFYTKKIFGVGPLMFNRVTTDLANQFGSYGKDLSSATGYIETVNTATKKEIKNLDINTKFNNIFKDQKFDSPFKKIIHWTNKILSFPLYMAKYMTKQMSDMMSKNDALGVFKSFDDLIKYMNDKPSTPSTATTVRAKPYKFGFGTSGFGTEDDPSMSPSYQGANEKGITVYKQIDPNIAGIRFNNPEDTKKQTIKDSGCAPVNAANIINGVAGANVMSVRDAANYAIQNGFKEQDGGTDISYFSSILKDNNIPSVNIPNNPIQIKNSLANHHPVVLLGKANNKSGGPFGKSSHFITATGLDKNGNIIVQNPESNNPYTTYKASDVFRNTTNALAVGKATGMGSNQIPLLGYGTGFGTVDSNKIAGIAATIISQSEGDYGSVNADDNGSMSIGKIQWNANSGRALPLLRKIVAMNQQNAKNILGDNLYREIANGPDNLWTRSKNLRNGRKASKSEKPKLSKLLDTKEGRAAQNATIAQDVPGYINYGIKNGITSPEALIYFADSCNQYGSATAWNKIKKGCGGSYTLDNLHKAMCSNGLYISRRNACYKMCKNWQQYPAMDISGNTTGVPIDTSNLSDSSGISSNDASSSKIGTIFDYITNIGNETLNKIWGADNVKAIFGDISGTMHSNETTDQSTTDISGGAQASPYDGTSINNFPYFNQADSRWAKEMYSSDGTKTETMANSACGPTALAMIAKSYGVQTDPLKMAQFSMKRGWRVKKYGTAHALMTQGAQELGLQSQEVNDKTAYDKVRQGFPVVASVGPGHFTETGHFITLVGVNKDGKYLVNDPSSTKRSQKPWDESIVSSESGHNWVISKDNEGSIGRAQGLGTGLGSKIRPKTVDTKNIRNILPQSKSELNGAGPIDTATYQNSKQNTALVHNTNGEATYMKVLGIIVDVLCKIADNTDKLSEVIKILNEKFDLNIKPEKTDKEKSVTKESMKRAITQSMKNSDGLAGSGSGKSSISKDAESIIRSLRMLASQ